MNIYESKNINRIIMRGHHVHEKISEVNGNALMRLLKQWAIVHSAAEKNQWSLRSCSGYAHVQHTVTRIAKTCNPLCSKSPSDRACLTVATIKAANKYAEVGVGGREALRQHHFTPSCSTTITGLSV
jgi:hypothetical protein